MHIRMAAAKAKDNNSKHTNENQNEDDRADARACLDSPAVDPSEQKYQQDSRELYIEPCKRIEYISDTEIFQWG